MNTALTVILISFCVVIIILMVIILVKVFSNKPTTSNEMKDISNNISQSMSIMSNHLSDIVNSIKDNENEKFSSINNTITKVDEAQNSLKSLSANIDHLSRIFTDKKTRGNFGETELYTILTSVYGEPNTFWQKQYGFDNKGEHVIVDAAILGLKNGEMICVDSKFPMENYLRMNDENLSDQDRVRATADFKTNVKKHIDDIHRKYILSGVTAEFAFMFLPSEAIFTQIYSTFDDLIRYSYDNHVYLASPTTLIAYLNAAKNMYLEFKKEQNANDILKALKSLADEFTRFEKRNKDLFDDLETFTKKFREVNLTSEKISKKFNNLNNLEDQDEDNID